MTRLRIVLVGETIAASRTTQRINALRKLGHEVTAIGTIPDGEDYETRHSLLTRIRYRLRVPADPARANARLLAHLAEKPCDLLWLDNARCIRANTIRLALERTPHSPLLWFSEDDMMNPRHRSLWIEKSIPYFNLWVTTKSYNLHPHEMPAMGVRRMVFVNNGFDPACHYPVPISEAERREFGADISFIGTFEKPRAQSMLALAEAGLSVRVWGSGWAGWIGRHPLLRIENRPVYHDAYAKVIGASRINLCFLRKFNRDVQTCRSIEIPACGGFMVHERTDEMKGIFAEDEEAVYFSNDTELVDQCRRWLPDEPGRQKIARAGLQRCQTDGLSHENIVKRILIAVKGDVQ